MRLKRNEHSQRSDLLAITEPVRPPATLYQKKH